MWVDRSSNVRSQVHHTSQKTWTWTVPASTTTKVSDTWDTNNVTIPDWSSKFLVVNNNWDTSSAYSLHWTSQKLQNKMMRTKNGNIEKKISIIHWNLGARLWTNKN